MLSPEHTIQRGWRDSISRLGIGGGCIAVLANARLYSVGDFSGCLVLASGGSRNAGGAWG